LPFNNNNNNDISKNKKINFLYNYRIIKNYMIFPLFNYSTIAENKCFSSLLVNCRNICDDLVEGISDETTGILPPDASYE
jgi:hypothetical protein